MVKHIMGHFLSFSRGPRHLKPQNCPSLLSEQFRGQKVSGPLKKSLKIPYYMFCKRKDITVHCNEDRCTKNKRMFWSYSEGYGSTDQRLDTSTEITKVN